MLEPSREERVNEILAAYLKAVPPLPDAVPKKADDAAKSSTQ